MILDPSDKELYQMKVDLVTGNATEDVLPLDIASHVHDEHEAEMRMDPIERQMWIDEYNNDVESRMPKTLKWVAIALLITWQAWVFWQTTWKACSYTYSSLFRFRIQFVADGYFKQKYGFKTVEKVTAVYNHLKTYYSHPSLGVKLDLVKLPVKILKEKVVISKFGLR